MLGSRPLYASAPLGQLLGLQSSSSPPGAQTEGSLGERARAGRHWGPSHSPSWDVANVILAHSTWARLFPVEWGVVVLQDRSVHFQQHPERRGPCRGRGQCLVMDEAAVVLGEERLDP